MMHKGTGPILLQQFLNNVVAICTYVIILNEWMKLRDADIHSNTIFSRKCENDLMLTNDLLKTS